MCSKERKFRGFFIYKNLMVMTPESLKIALEFVERETHLRTKHYKMLSDGIQGEFLQAFSLMLHPKAILEIGTFTGYSTLCLARGLAEGGTIDTIEIDDELEDIFLNAFKIAKLYSVTSHIGDAKNIIPSLNKIFDLVYIDANKREYPLYYELVFDKIGSGGYILADNVIWNGRALLDNPQHDSQTDSIIRFNKIVASDASVEGVILPIRDGLYVIRKK